MASPVRKHATYADLLFEPELRLDDDVLVPDLV